MMKLTRRGFTTLAAAAVGTGTLAACSGETTGDGTEPGGNGDAGSFSYWSMWQEGEDQQKVLSDEIEKFTAATGIVVDVQWSGREVLSQVVPRLNAGNPPDLVDNGAPDFMMHLGLDNLMDLSDVYDMEIPDEGALVSDVIPEALMDGMTNDSGQPFLVPYEVIGATMWFNANQTPELEQPPADWDEFMEILDALKAQGRTPLALDGDIADYCGYWVEWGVLRAGGPGALREAAQDATGASFENPEWVVASENVERLVNGGYFPDGFRGTTFPTQQASWADQSSPTDIILMGSWLPSEATSSLEQSGGDTTSIEFGSFPFPAVGENEGEGLVEAQPVGFAIPGPAQNADAAKQFIAWFMHKDRISRIASEAKNLTPRTDVEAPAELAGFAEEYGNATSTVFFTDGVGTVEPQWMVDVWQPTLGEFFGGNLDAAGFRSEMAARTVSYHENK